MIYRNAATLSVLVEFPSGFPDGTIDWAVYDEEGLALDTGSITPAVGAVSAYIYVSSLVNTLDTGDLSGYRDLVWTYQVNSEVVNGDMRYTIEARPPWGATPAGVRNKLGIEPKELADGDISLVRAYYDLTTLMGDPDLTGFVPTDRERVVLTDAIEAIAALTALPTIQMRAALKESSGTDTYQRNKPDWELLATNLRSLVGDGVIILNPDFDPFAGAGALFLLATPSPDPVTGV